MFDTKSAGVQRTNGCAEAGKGLTNCHSQDPVKGRILSPSDGCLELSISSLVSVYRIEVRKCNTHCPIADILSIVVLALSAQVKRVDRECLTPDFNRHVDLRSAVKNPNVPVEG